MTRTTNARLAGFIFLLYIATAITSMVLSGQTTSGVEGTAAKLASIAQHASIMRVNIVLTLLQAGYALVLAVTLYALTRDQDRDLAVMALCCRVGEGVVIAAVSTLWTLAPAVGRDDGRRGRRGRERARCLAVENGRLDRDHRRDLLRVG
jgi:hypothetical protein